MDLVGIEPGNYVLLHLKGEGESGDIVAVEIFNGDSSAMICHLLKNRDAFLFRPQCTTAAHQVLEFGLDEGDRYHVYGIVLGVFKPSGPAPSAPSIEQAAPLPEATTEPEDRPIPVEDYLLAFPLYSKIPAGGPKAVPIYTGRRLELDRFVIDDWPYYIVNLHKNDREINPGLGTVIFLKVIGDSMNDPEKADIQDGDYVLLLRQDSADDGDIVAAEVRGVDDLATLKRFEVRGSNRVALVPESTNPDHQEREFSSQRKGIPGDKQPFYIQGIALAVLKPYPKPNQ
jgi:SOS-response transcriptional repressor LexA